MKTYSFGGIEGWSKKGKALMDRNDRVVTVGEGRKVEEGIRGINGNGESTIKINR